MSCLTQEKNERPWVNAFICQRGSRPQLLLPKRKQQSVLQGKRLIDEALILCREEFTAQWMSRYRVICQWGGRGYSKIMFPVPWIMSHFELNRLWLNDANMLWSSEDYPWTLNTKQTILLQSYTCTPSKAQWILNNFLQWDTCCRLWHCCEGSFVVLNVSLAEWI